MDYVIPKFPEEYKLTVDFYMEDSAVLELLLKDIQVKDTLLHMGLETLIRPGTSEIEQVGAGAVIYHLLEDELDDNQHLPSVEMSKFNYLRELYHKRNGFEERLVSAFEKDDNAQNIIEYISNKGEDGNFLYFKASFVYLWLLESLEDARRLQPYEDFFKQ